MCCKCLKTIAGDAKPDPDMNLDTNRDMSLDSDADTDADTDADADPDANLESEAGIDNSDRARVEGNSNRGKERKPAWEWDSYAGGQRYWCGGYAFTAGRI